MKEFDKYGRILCYLMIDNININDLIINKNLVMTY
jgi:endonuclease YncB( thermonuclease family)